VEKHKKTLIYRKNRVIDNVLFIVLNSFKSDDTSFFDHPNTSEFFSPASSRAEEALELVDIRLRKSMCRSIVFCVEPEEVFALKCFWERFQNIVADSIPIRKLCTQIEFDSLTQLIRIVSEAIEGGGDLRIDFLELRYDDMAEEIAGDRNIIICLIVSVGEHV
jgi:hypothetical protein